MNKYDLIVVSYEPFPYGKAATNRMLSYLVGIAEEKQILYLCTASPSVNTPNKEKSGLYNNIHFRYTSTPVLKGKSSFLKKTLNLIYRYIALFSLLLIYKYKSVLLYSSMPFYNKIVQLACKIKRTNLFIDKTELVGYNYSRKTSDILKFKKDMKSLTGIVVISQGLYDYFDNLDSSKKFLLPVLVDLSRFKQQTKEKYFFCCSGANLERDGLLDCLNGFLIFSKKNKDYVFKIATNLNLEDPYHRRCKDIMDQHPDLIKYLGNLPSYEIPNLLCKSTALMLTPHKNYETKGFPTKLGEYLASGTPVICSSIDDLMAVLPSDTAYIVPPNMPEKIACALQSIVENNQLAETIAKKGRQLMSENYTIHAYKHKLIHFFKLS